MLYCQLTHFVSVRTGGRYGSTVPPRLSCALFLRHCDPVSSAQLIRLCAGTARKAARSPRVLVQQSFRWFFCSSDALCPTGRRHLSQVMLMMSRSDQLFLHRQQRQIQAPSMSCPVLLGPSVDTDAHTVIREHFVRTLAGEVVQ